MRSYPAAVQFLDPALAAQVLGYVGPINADQYKKLKKRGYQASDLIGRDGVEASYESVLRGSPQVQTVQVDPTGKQVGPATTVQNGSVGDDVTLTDRRQGATRGRGRVATRPRRRTHATEQRNQDGLRDVSRARGLGRRARRAHRRSRRDGEQPGVPAGQLGERDQPGRPQRIVEPRSNHFPLLNRATEGQYAPGSAFKLVTSLADTRYNVRSPSTFFHDGTGYVIIGADKQKFSNDNGEISGDVDLTKALTVSSDTYFYTAGDAFWNTWNNGDAVSGLGLQQQARDLGFGAKTGIDLDESAGRIPDPTWKQQFANAFYKDPDARKQNGAWYPGDQVHLAVGQGDVLVTPLQLADAYATFANGGSLVTPHVGMNVKDGAGKIVRTIDPKPRAQLALDPFTRDSMLAGFEGVTQNPKGTACRAFRGFPFAMVPGGIAGKTGTAQVVGQGAHVGVRVVLPGRQAAVRRGRDGRGSGPRRARPRRRSSAR